MGTLLVTLRILFYCVGSLFCTPVFKVWTPHQCPFQLSYSMVIMLVAFMCVINFIRYWIVFPVILLVWSGWQPPDLHIFFTISAPLHWWCLRWPSLIWSWFQDLSIHRVSLLYLLLTRILTGVLWFFSCIMYWTRRWFLFMKLSLYSAYYSSDIPLLFSLVMCVGWRRILQIP
jgi:hypothetical protein